MSVHPIHPGPPDQPGQQAADAQYYRGVLHDLINMGTSLARLLHQQATAQAARQAAAFAQQAKQPRPALALVPAPDAAPNPAPDLDPASAPHSLPELAAAFDRIARAVRRSIALARTLAEPVPPASDPAGHRAGARKRIIREIEDTIQRAFDDAERYDDERPDAEALRAELRDRMDAPDLDDDVTTRPAAEIITEICRDLGISSNSGARPWKRRTPEDIRQLCARAAAPSRTHQPTAEPQPGKSAAAPHAPTGPAPANPAPVGPASIPRPTSPANASPAHVGPVHAASDAPANAADLIATILDHPTYTRTRWRPPPGA